MKTFYNILIVVFLCFICYAAGWFSHKPASLIKEVEVIKNVDNKVKRDYQKIDCCDIAKKYDQTPFNLKYEVKELNPEYTGLTLKWDLYERNGEQEIRVPVYQQGNFKFYLGVGVGAAVIGASSYVAYKLLH